MNIKEKIKILPSSPGVYLMKDSLGGIIYVGKSKNLKSRVSSYFQNLKAKSPKVIKMVKNLNDFEYILVDTEFEAFLLECELIKELKPMYNRQMKNPQSYTYIKINTGINTPGIEISNEINNDAGTTYFGPYESKNTAARGIEALREYFKIPSCGNFKKHSPCLNHTLGFCFGRCMDSKSKDKYIDILKKTIKLLQGKDSSIIIEMKQKMFIYSNAFDFENAAKYRDYIKAVKYLVRKDKVVRFAKENKNIALVEFLNQDDFKFFLIKGNRILYSDKYSLKKFDELIITLRSYILSCFQYKTTDRFKNISKEAIDESQIINSYLKNKSNSCRYAFIFKKWLKDSDCNKIDDTIAKLISNNTNKK